MKEAAESTELLRMNRNHRVDSDLLSGKKKRVIHLIQIAYKLSMYVFDVIQGAITLEIGCKYKGKKYYPAI